MIAVPWRAEIWHVLQSFWVKTVCPLLDPWVQNVSLPGSWSSHRKEVWLHCVYSLQLSCKFVFILSEAYRQAFEGLKFSWNLTAKAGVLFTLAWISESSILIRFLCAPWRRGDVFTCLKTVRVSMMASNCYLFCSNSFAISDLRCKSLPWTPYTLHLNQAVSRHFNIFEPPTRASGRGLMVKW